MKRIFFVTSYGSIYNRVLPLIEEIGGDVTVICTSHPIYKFFSHYTNYNVLETKVNQNLFSKNKPFEFISNTLKGRKEYHNLFSGTKNAEIYFFGIGWRILTFKYLAKLSKENKVYLYPENQLLTPGKVKKGIKTKLMSTIIRIITGLNMVVYEDCGTLSLNISKKYIAKNNIEVVEKEMDKRSMKKYYKKIHLSEEHKILILTEDSVRYDRVTKEEMTNKMNALSKILFKNYPEQFVVKPHPNDAKTYGELGYRRIPSYIPSEFIMKHPWKIVIGTESMSLIKATELNDAKVISLLDFIKYNDKNVSSEFINWMKTHTDKILFPKNEKELKEMLI